MISSGSFVYFGPYIVYSGTSYLRAPLGQYSVTNRESPHFRGQNIPLKGMSPYKRLNIECGVCHMTRNMFTGSVQPTDAQGKSNVLALSYSATRLLYVVVCV